MKCNNCGRNEVNFHYSSSINGCVTETHLCSECAAQAGYDIGSMFDARNIFGNGNIKSLASAFEARDIFDIGNIFDNAFLMLPFTAQPGIGMISQDRQMPRNNTMPYNGTCGCGCGSTAAPETNVELDDEMSRRRELNIQMRAAVEKEDFEKAAQLRDMIKELET